MADIDVVVEENDVVLVVFDTEQGPAGPPGTAANTNATFVLVQPATGLPNSAVLQVGAGLLLQSTGGILTISATGAGTGTVTSVGISAPSDLFAVTGSPVTTNGTLALAKQSQSGNLIYASPSGSAGVPTFRNLSANDLAGLFKAGSNVSITGGTTLTIAATGLASGTVTSVGLSLPAIFSTGSAVTSSGNLTASFINQPQAQIFASPASGGSGTPAFRSLTYLDLPLLAGSNIVLTPTGSSYNISAIAGSGTVSSVALAVPGEFTVSGSPITGSGTFTIGKANQNATLVFAGPASGAAAQPTFRAVTYLDLPLLSGPNITLSPSGSNLIISSPSSGSVTSVALSLPNIFNVAGSPITQSGTLSATLVNQAASTFFAGPIIGANNTPLFRAIASSDITQALSGNLAAGSNISITPNGNQFIIATNAGSGIGSVTSVGLSLPNIFNVTGTPVTNSGVLTGTLTNQASASFWAGPISGVSATPSFRPIQGTDLYSIQAGANITLSVVGSALIITSTASGGGGGSVTQVTSGNLTNFATVNVATNTTTPAFTFTMAQAGSGQAFMGPTSGAAAAPGYRNFVLSDLPAGTYTVNSSNVLNNFASGNGTGVLAQNGSTIAFRTITGTANRIVVTNGDGSAGNPTLDLGSSVYTTSSSNTLNNLASSVPTAGQVLIGQTGGTFALATLAAGPGVQINTGSGFTNIAASGALGGTVTSVSGLSPLFTTNNPSTTPTFVQSNASSGAVLIGPQFGSAGNYTFRQLASSDIYGALSTSLVAGSNITLIPNVGTSQITISAAGSSNTNGTVTSVGLSLPSIFSVSGTPVTSSGTLTGTLANQASAYALLGPISGGAAAPTFRPIQSYDLSAIQAGTNVVLSTSGSALIISAAATGGGGVSSVSSGNLSPLFNTNVSNPTTLPTISYSLISQGASSFFAGPISGTGVPLFRAIASSDTIQALTGNMVAGTNINIVPSGNTLIVSAAGSGNVNNFTAGNLSPLFTTSVTSSNTAPNLSFTLSNASSGQFIAGPISGAAAAPTYRSIVLSDLPSGVFTTSTTGDVTLSSSTGVSAIGTNKVTSAMIRKGVARSVIGVTGNATANVADIQAASANTVLASNTGNTAITFRNIASGDFGANLLDYTHGGLGTSATPTSGKLPIGNGAGWTLATLTPGSGIQVTNAAGAITLNSYASAALLSAGSLSPLFTTSISNGTLSFTGSNAASATVLAGPVSGANGAYTFRSLALSDLPAGNYTVNYSNILNNLASGSGIGLIAQNGGSVAYRTLTGTAGRVTVTNGDGSAGNPTVDVGANVYTTSTSGLLNKLASATPANGQIPIGNGTDFTIANITAGSGIQVINGTGSITIGNYASGALIPSAQASGTVYAGPANGVNALPTFRALASGDTYAALKSQILAGTNVSITPNDSLYTLTINASGGGTTYTAGSGIQITGNTISSYASAAVLSVGSLSPLFTSSLSNGAVTFAQQAQASGQVFIGPANGGSANPTFRALASGDTYAAVVSNLVAGTNITLTPNANNKTITIAAAGGGGGSVIPSTNDFRMTLASGNAYPTTDITGATIGYLTPYKGTHISTYDSSVWTDHTSNEISLAIPNSAYRLYNRYVYWNGSALALEDDAWDSAGQVTGTITGATAANPCVLTATNSLSVGDFIFVDGIVGSLGTNAAQGLNGKMCRVSAVSGSTITLEKMDTTTLTYTSGGTFYKVPTTPATAPVRQDGVWCKTGNLSRRWVGTFLTLASGTTENSRSNMLFANLENKLTSNVWAQDTSASWNVFVYPERPSNANTAAGVGRVITVTCQAQQVVFTNTQCGYGFSGGYNYNARLGLNTNTANLTENTSMNNGDGGCNYSNGQTFTDIKGYSITLPAGVSFIQRLENNGFTGASASPWGSQGSGGGSSQSNGLIGSLQN